MRSYSSRVLIPKNRNYFFYVPGNYSEVDILGWNQSTGRYWHQWWGAEGGGGVMTMLEGGDTIICILTLVKKISGSRYADLCWVTTTHH